MHAAIIASPAFQVGRGQLPTSQVGRRQLPTSQVGRGQLPTSQVGPTHAKGHFDCLVYSDRLVGWNVNNQMLSFGASFSIDYSTYQRSE